MHSTAQTDKAAILNEARRIAKEVAGVHAAQVDTEARFPIESIEALKAASLLSAPVPHTYGGLGCSISTLAEICQTLAQHCATSAMVTAMHYIQVASIARHAQGSSFFQKYLEGISKTQDLIASVTSEVGVGGDLRSSACSIESDSSGLKLTKDAPTVSYGQQADALLVTCRRNPEASKNDQVLVLLNKADYKLEKKGDWDTLGMRGTCSPPFLLQASLKQEQILSIAFSEIAAESMVPYSHILWSACWLGIATDAVSKARAFVRAEARRKPGSVPPGAIRVAEVVTSLQSMKSEVYGLAKEYEELCLQKDSAELLSSIAFSLKLNNLKISASQLVVQIVTQAMSICGIQGYKMNSPFSLGRHLRDAHSAALMINNDRIYLTNASLLLVHKDD